MRAGPLRVNQLTSSQILLTKSTPWAVVPASLSHNSPTSSATRRLRVSWVRHLGWRTKMKWSTVQTHSMKFIDWRDSLCTVKFSKTPVWFRQKTGTRPQLLNLFFFFSLQKHQHLNMIFFFHKEMFDFAIFNFAKGDLLNGKITDFQKKLCTYPLHEMFL